MKKYQIYSFFCFLLLFFGITKINALVFSMPLSNKIIYIDAGHGGIDPGANYANVFEKDINLEIAKKLQNELMKQGAIVYMTREIDDDLADNGVKLRKRSDLYKRVKLINSSDADLYISIHLNAYTGSTSSGAQVFYSNILKENKLLAEVIDKEFKTTLKTTRNMKEIRDLYMYKIVNKPGVLVEVGFLSNSNDRYLLKTDSHQEKIAKSLTNGVITYFDTIK